METIEEKLAHIKSLFDDDREYKPDEDELEFALLSAIWIIEKLQQEKTWFEITENSPKKGEWCNVTVIKPLLGLCTGENEFQFDPPNGCTFSNLYTHYQPASKHRNK